MIPDELTVLEGLEKQARELRIRADAAFSHSATGDDTDEIETEACVALENFRSSAVGSAPRLFAALREAWRDVEFYRQREAAICQAVGGVCDNGKYRADISSHLKSVYADATLLRRIERERIDVTWESVHRPGGDYQVTVEPADYWTYAKIDPPTAPDLRAALNALPEAKP